MDLPDLTEIGVLTRHPANPILTPADVPYPCGLLFNAGVCQWRDGYVMIFRNDYGPTSAADFQQRQQNQQPRFDGTNLGMARSRDGVRWHIDPEPAITLDSARALFASVAPDQDPEKTLQRFYDPRLTVCEGRVYMCFAVDTKQGVRGGVAVTDDFAQWEILSLSVPDNRNMALFPEKIDGHYVRLERPVNASGGLRLTSASTQMWLSYSPDLRHWGGSRHLLTSADLAWANDKMGPGAPPIKTDEGWLTVFHGVWRDDERGADQGWEGNWPKRYSAGIMLLDLDNPGRIRARCQAPLLSPQAWYETGIAAPDPAYGFRRNVIFPGGLLREDDGEVKLYYGAADTVECLATGKLDDLVQACLKDGTPNYQ